MEFLRGKVQAVSDLAVEQVKLKNGFTLLHLLLSIFPPHHIAADSIGAAVAGKILRADFGKVQIRPRFFGKPPVAMELAGNNDISAQLLIRPHIGDERVRLQRV